MVSCWPWNMKYSWIYVLKTNTYIFRCINDFIAFIIIPRHTKVLFNKLYSRFVFLELVIYCFSKHKDVHIKQILWVFFLKGEQCKPGVVACTCSCYLRGWGIRITYSQKFETKLGKRVRPFLRNKTTIHSWNFVP